MTMHIGRSFPGMRPVMEEGCPCQKAACGLVIDIAIEPGCEQHGMGRTKTIRSMHDESACPALSNSGDIAGTACKHCEHAWTAHSTEAGCTWGWAYNGEGVAVKDGCYCPLANTEVGE